MYSYRISGDGFDTIVVDSYFTISAVCSEQFYMQKGDVVGSDTVEFKIKVVDGTLSLYQINTEASDVVILPKSPIEQMLPYSLEGATFKRFVIPPKVQLTLLNKALYGSDTVREFRSLSRSIIYDGDVFPATLQRRFV